MAEQGDLVHASRVSNAPGGGPAVACSAINSGGGFEQLVANRHGGEYSARSVCKQVVTYNRTLRRLHPLVSIFASLREGRCRKRQTRREAGTQSQESQAVASGIVRLPKREPT